MNALAEFPGQQRRAVSPYARRLARERGLDLTALTGSGPEGRVVAADVLSWRPRIVEAPVADLPTHPSVPVFSLSTSVSLAAFYRLSADAARVGLEIAIEDAAGRAVRAALEYDASGGLAIETEGRQVMLAADAGLSIGAERRLRLEALASGTDAAGKPALASLLVLRSTRVVPSALPLLPFRKLRFSLFVDPDREAGHALLCADSGEMPEQRAATVLESFAQALEQPLALLA